MAYVERDYAHAWGVGMQQPGSNVQHLPTMLFFSMTSDTSKSLIAHLQVPTHKNCQPTCSWVVHAFLVLESILCAPTSICEDGKRTRRIARKTHCIAPSANQ